MKDKERPVMRLTHLTEDLMMGRPHIELTQGSASVTVKGWGDREFKARHKADSPQAAGETACAEVEQQIMNFGLIVNS